MKGPLRLYNNSKLDKDNIQGHYLGITAIYHWRESWPLASASLPTNQEVPVPFPAPVECFSSCGLFHDT